VNILVITFLMFLTLFVGMAWGVELCFLLGAISVVFTFWLWGAHAVGQIASTIWGWMNVLVVSCIPMFVFMAFVLAGSGIADALYDTMYKWIGRVRGGLAMGTVSICTLFAAMTGDATMGVTTMGIIALPSMIKRKYNKNMVTGSIMAGAALGSLIPPSVIMIIYSLFSGESIGHMLVVCYSNN